jgi:diguanylate cyclase (GGDEF)-like protein
MASQDTSDNKPLLARSLAGRALLRAADSPAGHVTAIGMSLAASWLATLALGGAGMVAPHWFYLPVLLAAYHFGRRAAALTAATAMILAGPLMPADVSGHIPQTTGDWVSRGLFFLLIGQTMAWFFLQLRDERDASRAELSHRELAESRIRHLTAHDSLTGLANKSTLRDALGDALRTADGRPGSVALIKFDLDDFKSVNDRFGQQAGDDFLVQVAGRLLGATRGRDMVARLGGDEFVVLIEATDDAARTSTAVVERVFAAIGELFFIGGTNVGMGASAGLAIAASGLESADELMRHADVAMYVAKERGRGSCSTFEPAMHQALQSRLLLHAELRTALDSDEFVVHYQPVIALDTGRVIGTEALVRWNHPTRGLLAPAFFLSAAEDTGDIVRLGASVLRSACQQTRTWQDRYDHHRLLSIAVNVSARQLGRPEFVAEVKDALTRARLDPACLKLEVTESLLFEDSATVVAGLEQLRAVGVRVSIDDFGTGYSSMSRLRTLPVDELKIDRSFVSEIQSNNDPAPLVAATVAMAHGLGLSVVAEGVETLDQLAVLRHFGCDQVQGYLLGRPGPSDQAEKALVPDGSVVPAASTVS